jgi:hypothetical protein
MVKEICGNLLSHFIIGCKANKSLNMGSRKWYLVFMIKGNANKIYTKRIR